MLTKLLPDQISEFWDIIKYAIDQSTPPIAGEHPDKMNNILMSAREGSIDVWASYVKENKSNKFEGIVLTELLYDKPSKTRNMLIYCIYGYNEVDKQSWVDGIKAILKYANSKKCNQVVAYTNLPHIVEIVESLGGEAKYTFLSFDVKKLIKSFN